MQILWRLGKGFVKDILKEIPAPKPSYNTVSTIIRILETKGFVEHRVFGNTHEYYPRIDKLNYTRQYMRAILRDYFENSHRELVSFFAREDQLDPQDLEEIIQKIKAQRKNG